ncbi:hypothetical protein RhiirA5_384522 [Rhizophagus irregularis]|uniref:Uncharacterized protein n=1 Tax=Rhizophagus irregularis TaxID=588596 RepID=A0A2N0NSS8_9GLOM|nr:hypothetical protein RhiirA5_384522 [Rhizophagus irregularis]
MFDLWNVTPTEVHPEDVLDNVEDDENDNSAPNNSSNHVSTQSTKKSSDTVVELNTIACIIGEQLEPVNFSSKPKQKTPVEGHAKQIGEYYNSEMLNFDDFIRCFQTRPYFLPSLRLTFHKTKWFITREEVLETTFLVWKVYPWTDFLGFASV